MVLCLVALFVFGILGIFSARYRNIAKDAFRCVYLMIQFKPCDVKLEQRIKSKITAKLMKRTPPLAKFIYKNFKTLSWVFTILFFTSMFFTARAGYNLVRYGTCDPHSGSCIFSSEGVSCGSEKCAEQGCACEEEGCEAPDFVGCEGECDCQKDVCG